MSTDPTAFDAEFDALLDDANLPEKTEWLCLDGKLRREYEQTKARIEARRAERETPREPLRDSADVRLATPAATEPVEERDPEQDRLDELAQRMRAKLAPITVRAMPSRKYNRLLEQHPPRKDPSTGRFDARDYSGYNAGTFPSALVRASIVRPTITDDRWKRLDDALTDIQFDKLFNACAEVNRREEDIPFSPSGSEPPPT